MKLKDQSCLNCEDCVWHPLNYDVDFYCLRHEMEADKNGWCSEWHEREEQKSDDAIGRI